MTEQATAQPGEKTMRLRYAGVCRCCGETVPAGTVAVYERSTKTVRCVGCPVGTESSPGAEAEAEAGEPVPEHATADLVPVDVDPGQPGASARREHERRRANREATVRAAHPRLGGVILALSSDPQSTTAWATGAVGEEKLGARLNEPPTSGQSASTKHKAPRTGTSACAVSAASAAVTSSTWCKTPSTS
ncbi:MAG: hypothetical protein ACTHOK_19050, partial [Nocardioidaceae bacterium]